MNEKEQDEKDTQEFWDWYYKEKPVGYSKDILEGWLASRRLLREQLGKWHNVEEFYKEDKMDEIKEIKEIKERYREEWSIKWFQNAIEYLLFTHIKELEDQLADRGKWTEMYFKKWQETEARVKELEEGK